MIHDGLDIFGFTKLPFLNQTDKHFRTPDIDRTFQHLERHIRRGGFAVLTGPVGCGKSATIKYLQDALNPNHVRVVATTFSVCNDSNMIQLLCRAAGLDTARSLALNLDQLQNAFTDRSYQSVFLVIDEIQKIKTDTVEIVRLLVDATGNQTTIAVLLAGQQDFLKSLTKRVHEPLCQRIGLYARVRPLSADQTAAYITHCLADAGVNQEIFPPQACTLIHDHTKGVMRRTNSLAIAALYQAAEDQAPRVTLDHIHAAIDFTLPPELED
jgi:type II secretory pathway predicted ATPase ExeA